jgi:hypothetical protein
LVPYFVFKTERRAREFERYLKSGSGKVFAGKRRWRTDPDPVTQNLNSIPQFSVQAPGATQ